MQVQLERGSSIKAEPDACVTMSDSVRVGASLDGGLLGGLMRTIFSGESVFSQTLTATDAAGDAVLAASELGDVCLIGMVDEDLLLAKGAFLAADEAVEVAAATQSGLGRALFSGAGLFVLSASGRGTLAVNAHGSILTYQLAAGEVRAVDNGHLVAWSAGMQYEMRMAAAARGGHALSSMATSAASGEGLMCFFTGPGRLWLQTHKPKPVASSGGKSKR